MDLLLINTCASPAKSPCTQHEIQRASSSRPKPTDSRDGGQEAYSSSTKPTDSSSLAESGPFDALLGACVQGSASPGKTVPQGEQLLSMLGAGGPQPHSQEAALEGNSRETGWLPGKQTAAGESWPGLFGAEVARGLKEQPSQAVEVGPPRGEDGSLARQRAVVESDGLRCDRTQEETTEGAFLSKEGRSGRGETQEAGPRIMLSRMEALKGMEPAGEQKGGNLKPAGHAGQGENAASLAGKDGTAWKQEVQIELPTRPAPPPITSTQTVPAQVVQAGSGGTFRILRDAIHMRIQDEELGPMRWQIHMRGGRITAEAIVETTRVQELLQNHQDVLESKLNAMGVEVEEFDVSVDEGSRRFAAFSDPDGSGPTRRSTEDPPHDLNLEPVVSMLQRIQDRGLDLYV